MAVFRKPGLPLTSEILEMARQRWNTNRVPNYSLTVRVTGANKGLHAIDVNSGTVVNMTIDNSPVPEHVWLFWNVEGMFNFLAAEIARREEPVSTYGVEHKEQVHLSAKFNARYGYPERFMRHVRDQNIGVEWEVVEFNVP